MNATVIGPYRILRELGCGGMATVYEAEHTVLGVRRALKVFSVDEGRDAGNLRRRFLAEGRLLARFNHPRLVKAYDLGVEQESGQPYLAMDLVLGTDSCPHTLADLQRTQETDEEKLAGWYEDIRSALVTIHAAGVVHRDLKPENILVDADGHAVLSDFGISRVTDADLRAELDLTRTTTVDADSGRRTLLGTMAYLAPEVRAGGEPTPASDCWALGVTFFRLLTGMWYVESGAGAAALLLKPFDARWQALFPHLLATDPSARALPPLGRRRAVPWRWGLVAVLLAVFALVGGSVFRCLAARSSEIEVESLYVLPE